MQPKVSVIVPIYNVNKELLCKCLDCILNQTLKEIELICVLDCPTDGTDKVIEDYAQKDNRIKIVKNERNLHIGESRNRGIEAATGEYVGFFDDDDYCELTMYEKLYYAAKKAKSKISLCERNTIDEETNTIRNYKDIRNSNPAHGLDQTLKNVDANSSIFVWNHIYDTDFLRENKISFVDTKEMSSEDIIFNTEVFFSLGEQKEIGYIGETLYHHIYHPNNTGKTNAYMYRMPQYREYLTNIVNKNENNAKYNNATNVGNIVILYRIFRLHLKKEGISSAIRFLKDLDRYSSIKSLQKRCFKLWDANLTPPKNIFNWLLRIIA
ncbi:MAG: glycosyltransferase family 2 protein [Paludibacteraceae bacterium]|nr:glycosyltransferase family 2 protein [Paludibacteraceae bacterium]